MMWNRILYFAESTLSGRNRQSDYYFLESLQTCRSRHVQCTCSVLKYIWQFSHLLTLSRVRVKTVKFKVHTTHWLAYQSMKKFDKYVFHSSMFRATFIFLDYSFILIRVERNQRGWTKMYPVSGSELNDMASFNFLSSTFFQLFL